MFSFFAALRFDRNVAIFAFNCFAAAMLALFVGFSIGLPRPYWAMSTALIVSHPLSGAVRSKAIYRLFGTLLGAAVAIFLVPPLVDSPVLLSLAVSMWIGACLFVSLLDRTPRSYLMMLAGYTAAIIAFPSVNSPGNIFDIAVARCEEISIGIVCATVVHSLIFPRPVGATLLARLDDWLSQADQWALDVLKGRSAAETARERRQLAAAETEIHLLSTHLPFDTSHLRETTNVVRALHSRTLLLIPIIDGLNDRLGALRTDAHPLAPHVSRLIVEVATWIEGGASLGAAYRLRARLKSLAAATARNADWPTLLSSSLLTRLDDLVATLSDGHALLEHTRSGKPLPPALTDLLARVEKRPMHRDLGLSARSAFAAFLAVFLTCGLWIVSGWKDGGTAAIVAAMVSSFYASLDDPSPTIVTFGITTLVVLPIAAVYEFFVLPHINDFPMLALSLLPILLMIGVLWANPRTQAPGLAAIIGFCNGLALQETLTPDFAEFMNVNLAQFVGVFITVWVIRALRSVSVENSARRLLRHNWRDLAHHAQASIAYEPTALAARLLDRLALLTPKLAAVSAKGELSGIDVLHDLRIGMNLVALQNASPNFDTPTHMLTQRALGGVGDHYSARSTADRPIEAPPALLAEIDTALHAIAQLPASTAKLTGLSAMVGLRGNLFPKAAAYRPADYPTSDGRTP